MATTSGRIKDELRYDIWDQATPAGGSLATFGGGKGLEFIAAPHVQLLIGIPTYLAHSTQSQPDGFGDWPLMAKFRIASANAEHGDYLVTFLISATAPTGARPNGAGAGVLTPTLALGKGWRPFDVQTTFGINLPTGATQRLGRQLVWNTTFQYRAGWKLWPELRGQLHLLSAGTEFGANPDLLNAGSGIWPHTSLPGPAFLSRHRRSAGGDSIPYLRSPLDALHTLSLLTLTSATTG